MSSPFRRQTNRTNSTDHGRSEDDDNRARLARALEPTIESHHQRIDGIASWASAGSHMAADPILLGLVMAGRERLQRWFPHIETRGDYWTRTQVNHLITIDLHNAATLRGCFRPDDVDEQVWLLLRFLDERRLFHFDSDPIEALCEPLRCYSGLDERGRRGEGEPARPCRCYWPTSKQLELGLESPPPAMPDRFDWYQIERRAAEREWAGLDGPTPIPLPIDGPTSDDGGWPPEPLAS